MKKQETLEEKNGDLNKVKEDVTNYHVQQKLNESSFFDVLKTLHPELFVFVKMVMTDKLNLAVFYKIARHLININSGTGYGDIHIVIEDKTIRFVNGTEKDRVNTTITVQD